MWKAIDGSLLTQILQTTALSLVVITASAAGVRGEIVTVLGADGATGANGVDPGDVGGPGGAGVGDRRRRQRSPDHCSPEQSDSDRGKWRRRRRGLSWRRRPPRACRLREWRQWRRCHCNCGDVSRIRPGRGARHCRRWGWRHRVCSVRPSFRGWAGPRQRRASYRSKFCDEFGRQPDGRRCPCHEFCDWRRGRPRLDRKYRRCTLCRDWG